MIKVIPYEMRYLSGVVDVILPIQQSEFNIPITLEDQPDLLDIPGFYQNGRGNFWVAQNGSDTIGTIALLDIGNDQGALRKMFVKERFRGSKDGAAQRLLRVLLGWCRQTGIKEVFLGTTAKFLAAHRFYEKNGFRRIKQDQLPQTFPVMTVDTEFYKRIID